MIITIPIEDVETEVTLSNYVHIDVDDQEIDILEHTKDESDDAILKLIIDLIKQRRTSSFVEKLVVEITRL